MTRTLLIVAALLLSNLVGIAAAAEEIEHKPPNARKLIATLDSVGINNKEVKNLITEANSHVENQYFYFSDQPVLNGRLALRYHFSTTDNVVTVNSANIPNKNKKLELHYAPENSKFEIVANRNGAMVNYHITLK